MTNIKKYFSEINIYMKLWYNIFDTYHMLCIRTQTGLKYFRLIFIITLNICIMQNLTNAPLNNNDGFRLYSINAVSKKLKLGYTKTKKLIELGIIDSVEVTGKLMVPHCKLEKFINQNKSSLINSEKNGKAYADDEDEALKIISNLN